MKIFIVIQILLFSSYCAYAYEGTPDKQVDQFFSAISQGKTDEAIDGLYSSNPLFQQKQQALTLLKQQLGNIEELFGENVGSEGISNEELSASITRIVAVDKRPMHPIIWEFYFYKAGETWVISQAVFNDQFQFIGKKK